MLSVPNCSQKTAKLTASQHSKCPEVLSFRTSFMMRPTGQVVHCVTGMCGLGVLPILMATYNNNLNSVFCVASYNLHGLNNGRSYLRELCDNPHLFVIAVQEHWLTPNNIQSLNNIHPDFVGFGVSPMCHRLKPSIYIGCPYGSVAFLALIH